MKQGLEVILKVTTTGGAGVSAGAATSDLPVTGYVEAIQADYHASAPATTDLTITEAGGLARTLLTLANTATDAVKYPRVQVHDTAGTALTLDGTRTNVARFYVAGQKLTATLAQCDDLTNAVVVRIYLSEI